MSNYPAQLATPHHASEIIWVTRCGVTFRASRRTVQHLDATILQLRHIFPWAWIEILQPCYHAGWPPSAGTHDYDCVFDFRIHGIPWSTAEKFLRKRGWAAFWRRTGMWAPRSEWHIHAISLPRFLPSHPTAAQVGLAYHSKGIVVGEFIDGGVTTHGYVCATSQIVDYMAAVPLNGLADHSPDTDWHPADIPGTAFIYDSRRAA